MAGCQNCGWVLELIVTKLNPDLVNRKLFGEYMNRPVDLQHAHCTNSCLSLCLYYDSGEIPFEDDTVQRGGFLPGGVSALAHFRPQVGAKSWMAVEPNIALHHAAFPGHSQPFGSSRYPSNEQCWPLNVGWFMVRK